MSVRDLHNNIEQTVIIANTAITADGTTLSAIIDTADYMAQEFIAIASTVTDGSYVLSLQEGDEVDDEDAPTTITDAAAVDSDDILATSANLTLTVSNTGDSTRLGYIGTKRYVQLVITASSTSSGATFNALAVQGYPKYAATPDSVQ